MQVSQIWYEEDPFRHSPIYHRTKVSNTYFIRLGGAWSLTTHQTGHNRKKITICFEDGSKIFSPMRFVKNFLSSLLTSSAQLSAPSQYEQELVFVFALYKLLFYGLFIKLMEIIFLSFVHMHCHAGLWQINFITFITDICNDIKPSDIQCSPNTRLEHDRNTPSPRLSVVCSH